MDRPSIESDPVGVKPGAAQARMLDFEAGGHLYATHRIHPYAARCPPPLVDWAISRYTRAGDVVLDPMVGSGTTLVEAALLGRRGWGVEIDPLARLIAKVKATPMEPARIERARARIESLLETNHLNDRWRPDLPDLAKWFRADVCADLARLRDAISRVSRRDRDLRDLLWIAFSSLIVARTSVANARDLVHSRHHIREWQVDPDAPARFLEQLRRITRMMGDYETRLDGRAPDIQIIGSDARQLLLEPQSVDLVFSSPPYATALDYVRAHIFAVAWMADVLRTSTEEYRLLGRAFIGTERAPLRDTGEVSSPPAVGVAGIDELVGRLAGDHPKHAWIVWRYFRDMSAVLAEITRVLRPGGHAVLVVCPSNIRKIRIPTPDLFASIAEQDPRCAGRLTLEERHERTLHDRRRVMPYLEAAFGPRMRTEYVVVFRRQAC